MSPLVGAPNRGYADWQRVENYDTGVLFSTASFNTGTVQSSGTLDMSRFACVGGIDNPQTVDTQVKMSWYADAAATILVGTRLFYLASAPGNVAYYNVFNQGPFLVIQWQSLTGGNLNHSCTIIGTNRQRQVEFMPAHSTLIDLQANPIAASAVATVYPNDYYAGPSMLFFECSGATIVYIEALNAADVWDIIWALPIAAVTYTSEFVVTPAGAWRMQVQNQTAAAQTFYLTLTASATGSS